ncbi:MAG: 16S rRNA (adenine(1518)-N(6)/adenine(1519)-N(6))-dimethyltransferase [Gammaproteobacteria bacterium]|nr:16S rRNA (adenine(1518)-N(6)/adenine(1519)-N(6))-dimethyltransferase [Gammaproteobacteria bacterium]
MPYPKKRFGQNFLIEESIIQNIIENFNSLPGDLVVEIGPGRGVLTRELAGSGCDLTLIEIDDNLAKPLKEQFQAANVINQNVLEINFGSLGSKKSIRIIGNLPYNISTPLLFKLTEENDVIIDLHVMLQKEVAERITAPPGTKQYGRLSISMQLNWEATELFEVPPSAFYPMPKVNSAFVRLKPREKPMFDPKIMNDLLTAAFSARRKTIRNALRQYLNETELEMIGLNPDIRPENLTPEQFVCCANFLKHK